MADIPVDKPEAVDISPERCAEISRHLCEVVKFAAPQVWECERAMTALRSALTYEQAHHRDNLGHLERQNNTVASLRAALTASEQRIAEAVYQEREACIAIANAVGDKKDGGHSLGYRSAGWEIAELIKGRGANRA